MNATAMMEPFPGKRMHNFTRNKTTLEYINALHEASGKTPISVLTDSELVKSSWGGSNHGTWFHEDLAIYFAQWINPKFSVWCDQRIKEIFNQGFSALTPEATGYIEDEIGKEIRMINDIVAQIQSGVKHPRFEFTSHQKLNS